MKKSDIFQIHIAFPKTLYIQNIPNDKIFNLENWSIYNTIAFYPALSIFCFYFQQTFILLIQMDILIAKQKILSD